MLFTIISSLAAFERETLIERTNEGLAAARTRGKLGGRPKTDEAILKKAVALYRTGEYTIAEITSLTGISKSTLYRVLKQGFGSLDFEMSFGKNIHSKSHEKKSFWENRNSSRK